MVDNSGNPSLPSLRRQWQETHSEPALLRLVDACRKRGLLEEAVAILREGVRRQPRRLAPRVALGRCLLEAGELKASAEILNGVVDQDSTQLVANKLLVDVHLALGELDEAAERIDLYSLLNPGDPASEELQARLLEARRASAAVPAPPVAKPAVEISASTTVEPISRPNIGRLWAPSTDQNLFAVRPQADSVAYWSTVAAGPFGRGAGRPVEAGVARSEPPRDTEPPSPIPEPSLPPPSPPLPTREATATLASLHLHQGHPREAARIFREVLDRDPSHVVAQEGMVTVAASTSSRLQAADLLAVADPADRDVARRADRLSTMLRSYLQTVLGRS